MRYFDAPGGAATARAETEARSVRMGSMMAVERVTVRTNE